LRELLQTIEMSPPRRMSRKDLPLSSPMRHHPGGLTEVPGATGTPRSAFSSPVRQCPTPSKEARKKMVSDGVGQTSKIRRALLRFNLLQRTER